MSLIANIAALVKVIGADIKAIKTKVDGFKSDENGFLKTATSNLNPPDVKVNSIKAGATSPKIAFEVVRVPITLSAFKYNPDGSYVGQHYQSGSIAITASLSIKNTDILSLSLRLYVKDGAYYESRPTGQNYSGRYYELSPMANGYLLRIRSKYHAENSAEVPLDKSGQLYFDKETYVELFVIYKVD